MNDFSTLIVRWAVRILLLLAGAVFFLSLLAVACVLLCVWALRSVWAKITGKPVTPWVMPMRGGAAWSAMYQRAAGGMAAAAPAEPVTPFGAAPAGSKRSGILPKVAGDVSDVQPRELHEG